MIVDNSVTVLGDAGILRNDRLTQSGNAALAVNLVSADRSATHVYWLLPGADARSDESRGVWVLLPDWAPLALFWLLVVTAMSAVWRSRRLGPPVREPLPVVVRAAEAVEGRARLYQRADARGHAVFALRQATMARLRPQLGIESTVWGQSLVDRVVALVHERLGRPAEQVRHLLDGPAPADDGALIAIAQALSELENAVSKGIR